MRTAEFLAGAIGLVFGEPQRQGQVLQGELMRSVGIGLAPEDKAGKNRWRPNGHTIASQIPLSWLLGSASRKEWFTVARDNHSGSRHGNQRP